MKQDKYGIYIPEGTKIPLANDRPENTTRVYTTKNQQPFIKSEVVQCISMYKNEFKADPRTIYIPTTLEPYTYELKTEFKLEVRKGAPRPWQITLTQL